MTSDGVRRVQSGSPWEDAFGFARAVAAGDRVLVGGTTSFKGLVLYGEGDPYEQARVAFSNALDALGEFGLDASHVIRTRMLLIHGRDADEVGRAHKEFFDSVRPVTTLAVVSGFVDPRILVEVELEAFRPSSAADKNGAETA
ncbi:RidA family protein [Streptomyces sp. TRM66268-LWL]|uniref:RidA family protein n=1 Tax=Streptomyces polyasparticus TaxID=2767826 RepID=A0ABR7SCE9_9ACTN|nr:RidA family protein [Streptomyces polyasparticus]MBC9712166.1 RidA family protein [Streptomyces polyasparticus]